MRSRWLGLAALGVGLIVSAGFAQNQPDASKKSDRPHRSRGERPEGMGMREPRGMSVDQQMEQLTKELQLTTEQQDKIRKVITDHRDNMAEQFKARRAKMEENRDKIKEIQTELKAAHKARDHEKIKELQTQLHELLGGEGGMGESHQKLMSDIEAQLQPEQKEKFGKIRDEVFLWGGRISLEKDPMMLRSALRSLDLTSEQEQKIRGLFDESKPKSRGAAKKTDDRKAIAGDLYKKVMKELTPEQQEKLKEWRPTPGRGGHFFQGGERAPRHGRHGRNPTSTQGGSTSE